MSKRPTPGDDIPAPADDLAAAKSVAEAVLILHLRAGSHDKLAAQINARHGTKLSRQTIINWENGTMPETYAPILRAEGVPAHLLEDRLTIERENRVRLEELETRAAKLEQGEKLLWEAVKALEAAVAKPGSQPEARPSRSRRGHS